MQLLILLSLYIYSIISMPQLKDKDRQLKQHEVDMQKITQKCNNRIQAETDRMSKELEIKLCEQRHQLEVYSLDHTSQLFLLKNVCLKTLFIPMGHICNVKNCIKLCS